MFIETSLPRTSWIRKENINVMCIRNRFPIRKFFSAIKSGWPKEVAGDLRQPLIDGSLNITCFSSIGFQCYDGFWAAFYSGNDCTFVLFSNNCISFLMTEFRLKIGITVRSLTQIATKRLFSSFFAMTIWFSLAFPREILFLYNTTVC